MKYLFLGKQVKHFGKIADKFGVIRPYKRLGGERGEFCSWITVLWVDSFSI